MKERISLFITELRNVWFWSVDMADITPKKRSRITTLA